MEEYQSPCGIVTSRTLKGGNVEAKDRIICALDLVNPTTAVNYAYELAGSVGMFKIGLQLLFHKEGTSRMFFELASLGVPIMLDAKIAEIPTVTASAINSLLEVYEHSPPKFITVHASMGMATMQAALEAAGDKTTILGVTLLTSITSEETRKIYIQSPEEAVYELIHRYMDIGGKGIVCSSQDLYRFGRKRSFKRMTFVTPGIRPKWASANDQARIMTPAAAVAAGADYLVIGRPIIDPPKKIGSIRKAAELIAEEIANTTKP